MPKKLSLFLIVCFVLSSLNINKIVCASSLPQATSLDETSNMLATAVVDSALSPEAYLDNSPVDFLEAEAGLTPQNFWYFLDSWYESFRLAVTFNSIKKVSLLQDYNNERLEEITAVLNSKVKIDKTIIDKLINKYSKSQNKIFTITQKDINNEVLSRQVNDSILEQEWLMHNVAPFLLTKDSQSMYVNIRKAIERSNNDTLVSLNDVKNYYDIDKFLYEKISKIQDTNKSSFAVLNGAVILENLLQIAEGRVSDELMASLLARQKNIFTDLEQELAKKYKKEDIGKKFENYIQYIDCDMAGLTAVLNKLNNNNKEFDGINYDNLMVISTTKLSKAILDLDSDTISLVINSYLNSDTNDLHNLNLLLDILSDLYKDSNASKVVANLATKVYTDLLPVWKEHGDEITYLINQLYESGELSGEEISKILSIFGINLTDEQIKKIDKCIDTGACQKAKDIFKIIEPLLTQENKELANLILMDLMDGTLDDSTKDAIYKAFKNRNVDEIRKVLDSIDNQIDTADAIINILIAANYPLTDEQKELIKIVFTNLDDALTVENTQKVISMFEDKNLSSDEKDQITRWLSIYDEQRTLGSLISFYGAFKILPELTQDEIDALAELALSVDNLTTVDDIGKVRAIAEDGSLSKEEVEKIKQSFQNIDANVNTKDLVTLLKLFTGISEQGIEILTAVLEDIDEGFSAGEVDEIMKIYKENKEIPQDVKNDQKEEFKALLNKLDYDIPLEWVVCQVLIKSGYSEILDDGDIAAISEFFSQLDEGLNVDSIIKAKEDGLTIGQKQTIINSISSLHDNLNISWVEVFAMYRNLNLTSEEETQIDAIINDTIDEIMQCINSKDKCTWEDVLGNDPQNIIFLKNLIKEQKLSKYDQNMKEATKIALSLILKNIDGITSEEVLAWYNAFYDKNKDILPSVFTQNQIIQIADGIENKSNELTSLDEDLEDLINIIAQDIVKNEKLSSFLEQNSEKIAIIIQSHSDEFIDLIKTVKESIETDIDEETINNLYLQDEGNLNAAPPKDIPVDSSKAILKANNFLKNTQLNDDQKKKIEDYKKQMMNAKTIEQLEKIENSLNKYINSLSEMPQGNNLNTNINSSNNNASTDKSINANNNVNFNTNVNINSNISVDKNINLDANVNLNTNKNGSVNINKSINNESGRN